ncbi:MAG: hypothetical protein HYV09_21605 [Deltaproteobacteria bacterium]|nr:hypothetical protein [Deltaproteobacteria bacterium]
MTRSSFALLTLVTLVTAPLALVGCAKKQSVDSQDVTTHGMSLELDVVNDGTRSNVYAALHVGDWQSLVWARLSSGDQLIMTDPKSEKRALGVVSTDGKTAYGADLAPMDGTFTLDFVREKGASALGNKAVVPPSFTIKVPASVSRKEALTFTWESATGGHKMAYEIVSASCLSSHVEKDIIGDPGTFTLNAGELKALSGKDGDSCEVTLKLTRTIITNSCCSAEFGHPSRALGRQERVVRFTTTP